MGVTLHSPSCYGDMGYGGFMRLRLRVAALVDLELHELYMAMLSDSILWDDDQWAAYNAQLDKVCGRLGEADLGVVAFLHESDCDGSCSPNVCKRIRELMAPVLDEEGSAVYGYAARPDAFTLSGFDRLLADCVACDVGLVWS